MNNQSPGRIAGWILLALAGLAVAVALSVAASNLSTQPIGLEGQPLRAGDRLAPAPAQSATTTTKRTTTRTRTPDRTRTTTTTSTTTSGGDDHGGRGGSGSSGSGSGDHSGSDD